MVGVVSYGRFCQFFRLADSLFLELIDDESQIGRGHACWIGRKYYRNESFFFLKARTGPIGGFEPTACFDIWLAAFHILNQLYDSPFPSEPQNDLVPEKVERNAEIRARYEQGETVGELAADFEISEQRVSQIIHGRRD